MAFDSVVFGSVVSLRLKDYVLNSFSSESVGSFSNSTNSHACYCIGCLLLNCETN